MLTVALTGGIATGKSVVARLLRERGCYVYDGDRAARALMEPGQPAWQRVAAHFGPDILNPDRSINRRRLGDIIFADEAERRFLDDLIHPLVLEQRNKAVAALEKEGRFRLFISEAALTIEAGYARFFDKVIVVWCRPEIQMRRLMDRDRIGPEEARRKIQSQMDLEEKKRHADYLIDTSGALEDTERQTEDVFRLLERDEGRKASGGA